MMRCPGSMSEMFSILEYQIKSQNKIMLNKDIVYQIIVRKTTDSLR